MEWEGESLYKFSADTAIIGLTAQYMYVNTNIFNPSNVFNLWLVESTDAGPTDMESQLYLHTKDENSNTFSYLNYRLFNQH